MTRFFMAYMAFATFQAFAQKDTVFLRYNTDETDKVTYKTDTVYFETPMRRHILMGTTILPSTHGQQTAMGAGLYFEKVTLSDCQHDMTMEGYVPDKVGAIINSDKALTIELTISENCCYSFLCDISIENDTTLNLIYHGYGTYCSCDCCFGLTYRLTKEESPELHRISSVMINGSRKTLRRIKSGP